jgi:hypothetical protein
MFRSVSSLKGLSRRDASWQIGNVSRPIALGLLKNDRASLAHGFVSNPAACVLVVMVATCRPDVPPAIHLNEPHQIANLHQS